MMASKKLRILAFAIDMIGASFVFYVLKAILPIYSIGSCLLWGREMQIDLQLSLLAIPFYFLVFDFVNDGHSIGKMLMSVKTVAVSSRKPPNLQTRIGRTFLKTVNIAMWPFALVLFAISSVTLQDSIANTVLVKK